MNQKAYFVAGGTGGHINGAITLGREFSKRGYEIGYISGKRYLDFQLYADLPVIHFPAKPILGRNILNLFVSFSANFYVFVLSFLLFIKSRPAFVLGCGGYVCGPVLLAAKTLRIPCFIVEQNSVLGLTNKILAKLSDVVFTSFLKTIDVTENIKDKIKCLGNPIRQEFYAIDSPSEFKEGELRVLVFGGSLGAKEINELIREFLKSYQGSIKLKITHQIGKNRLDVVKVNENIDYKQLEYIDDMPGEYKKANIVIARSGASTVSELALVKRTSILIPITFHADKHQVHNANSLRDESEFPVYVENSKDLEAQGFAKLHSIIENEHNRNRDDDQSWFDNQKMPAFRQIADEIESFIKSV